MKSYVETWASGYYALWRGFSAQERLVWEKDLRHGLENMRHGEDRLAALQALALVAAAKEVLARATRVVSGVSVRIVERSTNGLARW